MPARIPQLSATLLCWSLSIAGLLPATAAIPELWVNRGAGGGGAFYSPAINPANTDEFYVGSDMTGLYHTTNFGDAYTVVGCQQIQGGHYSAVQFTNDPNIRYCITHTSDLPTPLKSTDGGKTWAPLAGNPLPFDTTYSLWVDYNNPNRLITAGYAEIYFSSDGGTSFQQLDIPIDSGTGVVIGGAFFDGSTIYLGTSIGLLVSTDGGSTFTNAQTPGITSGEAIISFTGAKTGSTTRLWALTAASGDVYGGLDPGGNYYGLIRGIYSFNPAAGTWTSQMTGIDPNNDYPVYIAAAANDISTVYAAGGSSSGNPVVFKTTNGGTSWSNVFQASGNSNIITGWSGQGGDRGWGYGEVALGLTVARSDASRVLFTDLGFVHRSRNGGTTWQQAYVSPADQHPAATTAISHKSYHSIGLENTSCWQILWSDAQNLFAACTDIKGLRSSDGGATWSYNYTGHNANTMYRLAKHPVTGVLYAGTSDIHDMYQSTRLADSLLNNADANGKILFSSDKGASWQTLHSFGHPVFWVSLDPTSATRLYASVVSSVAGVGGVYVSNNIQNGSASTWTRLPSPPRTEGHPASIVVLDDGKVLCSYSGRRTTGFTASSGVFLYNPTAGSWSDLSDPGMNYWTKDIVLDPADPAQNTWYVCVFSGWGGPPNGLGGVYRTTDRGAHWAKINSLDRVTSLTFNPSNSSEVFLTTETEGLWHTNAIQAATPVFTRVNNYLFRQPERVFFNPYDPAEVWVTSFGYAMAAGNMRGFALGIAPNPGQAGQMNLTFGPVQFGASYTTEWCTDLTTNSWLPLSPGAVTDLGLQRTLTDSAASQPRKFYRVRSSQP